MSHPEVLNHTLIDASEFRVLRTSYTTLNLLPADSFQQNLHDSKVCGGTGGILTFSFSNKDVVDDLE